jgi:hypothetical protein
LAIQSHLIKNFIGDLSSIVVSLALFDGDCAAVHLWIFLIGMLLSLLVNALNHDHVQEISCYLHAQAYLYHAGTLNFTLQDLWLQPIWLKNSTKIETKMNNWGFVLLITASILLCLFKLIAAILCWCTAFITTDWSVPSW